MTLEIKRMINRIKHINMDDNSLKEFFDGLIFNGKLNLIYTINDMYVLADVYNKGTKSDFETPVKP